MLSPDAGLPRPEHPQQDHHKVWLQLLSNHLPPPLHGYIKLYARSE